MKKLYPDLTSNELTEAAQNLSAYVQLVARIYDRLKAEGKWEQVKLRLEYDNRSKDKPTSQNKRKRKNDTKTPDGASNELSS